MRTFSTIWVAAFSLATSMAYSTVSAMLLQKTYYLSVVKYGYTSLIIGATSLGLKSVNPFLLKYMHRSQLVKLGIGMIFVSATCLFVAAIFPDWAVEWIVFGVMWVIGGAAFIVPSVMTGAMMAPLKARGGSWAVCIGLTSSFLAFG